MQSRSVNAGAVHPVVRLVGVNARNFQPEPTETASGVGGLSLNAKLSVDIAPACVWSAGRGGHGGDINDLALCQLGGLI